MKWPCVYFMKVCKVFFRENKINEKEKENEKENENKFIIYFNDYDYSLFSLKIET